MDNRTVQDIAMKLNKASKKYKIGQLQQLRKQMGKDFYTYNIFSKKSAKTNNDYAFHSGGRKEIQFNIGYHDDTNRFRYGLAFSIQQNQNLPDPVGILRPRIYRFNKYLAEHLDKWKDMKMYYWDDETEERSDFIPLELIAENNIKNGKFIFLGQYLNKSPDKLDDNDLHAMLDTLDDLLEIYIYVENYKYIETTESIKEKITRICWNTQNWQQPTGPKGKSKDTETYENRYGYGYEEWLFDFNKIINGYHYSYLQSIGYNIESYRGKTFNIYLYSIDGNTGNRYWVGKLNNAHIINVDEAITVYQHYYKKGWITEMRQQLESINADVKNFNNVFNEEFITIKFLPNDIEIYDEPILIPKTDPVIKKTRYSNLYRHNTEPLINIYKDKQIIFQSGHNPKTEIRGKKYNSNESEIEYDHNRMVNNSYLQLVEKYGKDYVGTDNPTGYGTEIDTIVKHHDYKYTLYEMKTACTSKRCIREAIGQLLEYAYFSKNNNIEKLIVVGPVTIENESIEYLKRLRKQFKLRIYYQRYNSEKEQLIDTLY